MTIKITSPTLAIALLLAIPAVCGAEETLDSDLESEIVRGEKALASNTIPTDSWKFGRCPALACLMTVK